MQVQQIQVLFDAVQDRLTLRIATSGNEEFRVFFTRRFLRGLWPNLVATLNGPLAASPQTAPALPEATSPATPAANTGQSSQSAQSAFDTPFRADNPIFPLGATPLLATEAVFTPHDNGTLQLTFREGQERRFNLGLNAELMQALCAMLRASANAAQWDLAIDYAAAPQSSEPAAVVTPPPSS